MLNLYLDKFNILDNIVQILGQKNLTFQFQFFFNKNCTVKYILIKIGTESNNILPNTLLKYHIDQYDIF